MEKETVTSESSVRIANDVVGKIAAIAALEVDGVAATGNNITAEIMGKVRIKNLMKNVKVEVMGKKVNIEISITVEYGVNIQVVSNGVQERIKQAVENMTGLDVNSVNVRIAGVNLNKEVQ